MIAIKTEMNELPRNCDYCPWYASRPHPYKGWTEECELMNCCMDDDAPEDWVWDGDKPPKGCPLFEVPDEHILPRKDEEDED